MAAEPTPLQLFAAAQQQPADEEPTPLQELAAQLAPKKKKRDMSQLGADIAAAGGQPAVGKVAQPDGSYLGALQGAATSAFGVPLAGAYETARDFLDKHPVAAAVVDPNKGRSDIPRGITAELRAKAEQQRADYLQAHPGMGGAAAELAGEFGVNLLPMAAGAPAAFRALGVTKEAPTLASAAIGALRGAGAGAAAGGAAGYAGSYGEEDRLSAAAKGALVGATMGAVGGAGRSPEPVPGVPSSEAVAEATRGLGQEAPPSPLRALAQRFQEERAVQAARDAPWQSYLADWNLSVDDFDRLGKAHQGALRRDFINRKGEYLHALPEEPGADGAGQAQPPAAVGAGDAEGSGGVTPPPQPAPPLAEAGSAAGAPEAPGGAVLETPPRIYRETNLERLLHFADPLTSRSFQGDSVHFADHPDLALGQGDNRGVLMEFDPSALNLEPAEGKPAAAFLESTGGPREVVGNRNTQGAYQRALQAFTIKPGAATDAATRMRVRDHVLPRLVADGWQRTVLDDGSVRMERPAARVAPQPTSPPEEPITIPPPLETPPPPTEPPAGAPPAGPPGEPPRPRAFQPPPAASWDPAQIAAERGLYGSAYEIRRQYVADADLAHQAADETRQSIRAVLPDQATREDATAYLQGTGNKRVGFNDTPDDVRARLDASGARPAVDQVLADIRPQLDHLRDMVNDLGFQDVPYIKDYIHQMWEAPKDVEAPEGIAGRGGSGTASPVTKERSFKSIAQGMAMGYEPKTLDLAELVAATQDVYRKTLALHSALDEVSKLPALPDGNPVVARGFKAPNDQYVDVTNTPALAQVARRMEAKANPEPAPEVLRQFQLETGQARADQAPQGALPFAEGAPAAPDLKAKPLALPEQAPIGSGDRLYLHRQVWTNLRPILQHREPWAISRAYDAMSNLAKRAIFSFSLFHPLGSLTPNAIIGMGPFKGLTAALKGGFGIPGLAQTMDSFAWTRPGQAMIEDAIRDGVKIPPPEADVGAAATSGMLGSAAEAARKVPGVGGALAKVPEGVNGLYRLNDEALWSVHGLRGKLAVFTHDQWKNRLIAYRDYLNGQPGGRPWAAGIEAKLLGPGKKAALKGMSDDQIGQMVGRWTSDLYGDQQWKLLENRLANDPKTMRVLSKLHVPEFAKELLDPSSELHQKAARRSLIAPDWFYSSVKAPLRSVSSDPVMATMGRHYLKNALGLYVGYNLLNKAMSGHYMYENPPGYRYAIDIGPSTEKDGSESATKHDYVNVGKQEMELPDWLLGVEKGPRPGRWPVIGAPLRKINPVPAAVIGGLGGHYPSGYPSPTGMAEATAARSGEPLSGADWMGALLKTMAQPYTPIPVQNFASGGLRKALIPFPVSRGPAPEEAP
jgi:hypothetical protein